MIFLKVLAGAFWLCVTGLTVYLAHDVMKTESDPQRLWGWMVVCAIFFAAASLLTYLMLSSGKPTKTDE